MVELSCSTNKSGGSVLHKCKSNNLPIDLCLELFDSMVKPVLTYGCETWGYEDLDMLEKVKLKFCKYILNVRPSTPTCLVYGELGIFPLHIYVHTQRIVYWVKVLKGK